MSTCPAPAISPILDPDGALRLPADLGERLLALSAQVGHELCRHYNNVEELDVLRKADSSPVTAADHAAHDALEAGLRALTPDIPVLSEESAAEDIEHRREWPLCWMIDPLDGTKEFIGRTGEFTINIALIRHRRPVLGLIAIPIEACAYFGVPSAGVWRCDGADYGRCQALPAVPPRADGDSVRMLASERHHPDKVAQVMDKLAALSSTVERLNAGSAIKFCALLDGRGDVYPRTSPCYEWDVAAGDALVHAAGGIVVDADGEPLRYNSRDTLLVERLTAAMDPSINWMDILA